MNKLSDETGLTLKGRMERFCSEALDKGILFQEAVNQFEHCFITEALHRNNGNIVRTSAILGIHRNTLSKKLRGWQGMQKINGGHNV